MLALRIILILLVLFFGKVGKALVNTPDATEQVNKFSCCAFRNNCSNSIVEVLTNMTSNGVTEITTDTVLPSLVMLEGLENIVVVGRSNVSMHCNSVGAVKFITCRNVTIKGINWFGCGSKNEPGIEFRNSSNITIVLSITLQDRLLYCLKYQKILISTAANLFITEDMTRVTVQQ